MPRYTWIGILLDGQSCKGVTQAASLQDLEQLLAEQDIGLVKARAVQPFTFFSWKRQDSVDLFANISLLLESGIFLTEALKLYRDQLPDGRVRDVVADVTEQVSKGSALHSALEQYPNYFDDLSTTVVRAGEESGYVGTALTLLSEHLEHEQEVRRRLQASALSPAITFCLFVLVSIAVMVFFVPRFASFFEHTGGHLPRATSILLTVSETIRAYGLYGAALLSVMGIAWWRARTYPLPRMIQDRVVLMIPVIGTVIEDRVLVAWLTSLTLLTRGAVTIVQALAIAQHVVTNTVLAPWYECLSEHVSRGLSLSKALEQEGFPIPLCAMVSIGEESSRLPTMLERCKRMYEVRLLKRIELWSALLGPLLLLILGCLIAVLIVALYVPLLELSTSISDGMGM